VAGAVGGLVGSLVFGGDVGQSVARGAVVGAAVGGTAGAISASQNDKRKKQAHEAELEKLRQEIGRNAYNGLAALAECKHDISLRQAAKAQRSENSNHALAGL
jgi:predicted negative regulator of RcsB-dependent stress response